MSQFLWKNDQYFVQFLIVVFGKLSGVSKTKFYGISNLPFWRSQQLPKLVVIFKINRHVNSNYVIKFACCKIFAILHN